jgi:hypothetical protein
MVSRVRQVLCAAPLLACVKPAMTWVDEAERPLSADAGGANLADRRHRAAPAFRAWQ